MLDHSELMLMKNSNGRKHTFGPLHGKRGAKTLAESYFDLMDFDLSMSKEMSTYQCQLIIAGH